MLGRNEGVSRGVGESRLMCNWEAETMLANGQVRGTMIKVKNKKETGKINR